MEPAQQHVPADAQRSDDGNYWWDTSINDWRPVPGGAADTAAAGAAGAAAAAEASEQAKARVAAGMPGDKNQLSDEHRARHLSADNATIDAGEDEVGQAEVVAMQGSEGTEHEGEGIA